MRVGDLVVCSTVAGMPVGLIVERSENRHVLHVLLRWGGKMITACFQTKQLELVNANR
jgi:hypothetical protein